MSFDTLPLTESDDGSLIQIQFLPIQTNMSTLNVIRGRRLKAGDTAPDMEVELIGEDDDVWPVPDGATVIFGCRKRDFDSSTDDFEYLTSGYDATFDNYTAGKVVNASDGIVAFDWADADTTDQVGTYDSEFRILWTGDDSDQNVKTFPAEGFTEVTIDESL